MSENATSLKTKAAGLSLALVLALIGYGMAPETAQITKESEGRVLKVYVDPVGVRTVCDGHTRTGLVDGKVYTPAECDAFLVGDFKDAVRTVESCITAPLNPNQKGALVDFAFNVGPGGKGIKDGLCSLKSGKQPRITRLFNEGQYAEACKQFPAWNLQKLRGIDTRRQKEMALCLKPI